MQRHFSNRGEALAEAAAAKARAGRKVWAKAPARRFAQRDTAVQWRRQPLEASGQNIGTTKEGPAACRTEGA